MLRVVRLLDGARRADLPGRQPAHQAGASSGSGCSREVTRDRPRRALPGRGVHPAGDDAHAGARSASTSPTRTSPGATRSGSSRSTSTSCRRRDRRLHAARTSSSTPPTSCTRTCSTAARRRSRSAPCWPRPLVADLGRVLRLRAVRARRRAAGQRGVPRLREVPATGPRDWAAAEAEGRTPGAVPHPAQRDPPRAPGAAAAAQPALPPRRRRERARASPSARPVDGARRHRDRRGQPRPARAPARRTVHLDMPRSAWTGTTRSRCTTSSPAQTWHWGEHNYVRLDPYVEPAHVLHRPEAQRAI